MQSYCYLQLLIQSFQTDISEWWWCLGTPSCVGSVNQFGIVGSTIVLTIVVKMPSGSIWLWVWVIWLWSRGGFEVPLDTRLRHACQWWYAESGGLGTFYTSTAERVSNPPQDLIWSLKPSILGSGVILKLWSWPCGQFWLFFALFCDCFLWNL